MDVRINDRVVIPESEMQLRFSRASGPGGQNVNKRDTRVEIIFDVDGSPSLSARQKARIRERLGARIGSDGRVRVVSGAARTQADNRAKAVERLCALLAEGLRPPPRPRVPTKPSKAARARRVDDKKRVGQKKRARQAPRSADE